MFENKALINKDDETIDEFHRGRFSLVQPRLNGHRAGMDAMLLAGLVPTNFQGSIADFGAGAGAAGFAVASRCLNTRVTLIERSSFMLPFAKKSLSLAKNAQFIDRISLLEADVSLKGKARESAGLIDNSFDFAIMNPPFNSARDRSTPNQEKATAHVMPDSMFEDWVRSAAAILKPGGFIGLIARPQSLEDILQALNRRFGDIKIIPLHSRHNMPAIRILIHAKHGSRADLSILPPLTIHSAMEQNFSMQIDAINNGSISIWDLN